MKASELRIGNLLLFSNKIQPDIEIVVGRRFFSSASIEKEDGDFKITPYYQGIPLTNEWMLRLGFKNTSYGWESLMYTIEFDFSIRKIGVSRIQHVHQLQNLYFALTGNELEIK